jgi:hypothetical protein
MHVSRDAKRSAAAFTIHQSLVSFSGAANSFECAMRFGIKNPGPPNMEHPWVSIPMTRQAADDLAQPRSDQISCIRNRSHC